MMKYFIVVVVLTAAAAFITLNYGKAKEFAWAFGPTVIEVSKSLQTPQKADAGRFKVPDGFTVEVFASSTPSARVLARDPRGTLVLSETGAGKVVALPDTNSDGRADAVIEILSGLTKPHGIAFGYGVHAGKLYVGEENAVSEYDYDPSRFAATNRRVLLALPSGAGHFTRTLQFHPDDRLLVSVGSSCNACNETDARRASVIALNLDTGTSSTFAKGLRNAVFMAVDPKDGSVWATDNGRDLLGDDTPPDEVNILREGGNYGWPICYGKNVHDTEADPKQYVRDPCADMTPATVDIESHAAALGLGFIPEGAPQEGWPEEYQGALLVALHGSWNRSTPSGYRIVLVHPNAASSDSYSDFMTGFLQDGKAIARPVAVLPEAGGSLFVSDDLAGAVYRVFWVAE